MSGGKDKKSLEEILVSLDNNEPRDNTDQEMHTKTLQKKKKTGKSHLLHSSKCNKVSE